MRDDTKSPGVARRDFLKTSAAAGAALLASGAGDAQQESAGDGLLHRNERPDRMRYRRLGRTNLMCSRLVFGCGAALIGNRGGRLLESAFDQGINHFDVGRGYTGSEANLAPFLERHRGEIWVTSKAGAAARVPLGPNGEMNSEYASAAAELWLTQLDRSLAALKTDYIDAYYIQGVANPDLVRAEEIGNAFLKAKDAGKVGYFGFSSHDHAGECLEAAIETDWYALAMIGICPAGWYDWASQDLAKDTPTLQEVQPLLRRAREADIGLIGMKVARHIAVNPYSGSYGPKVEKPNPTDTFDKHYDEKLLKASLSPFQRSYAYVLENGMDVVNADMQNFEHFEENLVAARTSHQYFA